jgi:hypothetical protein
MGVEAAKARQVVKDTSVAEIATENVDVVSETEMES